MPKSKYDTQRQLRLLQLVSIPNVIWEDLEMDFIISLTKMNEKAIILVEIDRFISMHTS